MFLFSGFGVYGLLSFSRVLGLMAYSFVFRFEFREV